MSGKRKFEEQVAALDALRTVPDDARIDPLRKALGNRNNFVVAKAADLAREFHLYQLIPDLLTAFHRFFESPEKSDPQCWAKNAISRALATMEHQDPETFLLGMHHLQMEAVWGGRSDTAGTLRATCALALVQCRSLSDTDLLAALIDLLADKDKSVRTEIVRAIEQVGSPAAGLILRLRATLAADEPEVLGACYSAILQIEGVSAIRWISRFLASEDEAAAEAALAIAATHSVKGLDCLTRYFLEASDRKLSEPWWRSVLLSAIALARQEPGLEFLLELIESDSADAEAAIDAILRAAAPAEVIQRMETIVAGNQRLARHFATRQKTS